MKKLFLAFMLLLAVSVFAQINNDTSALVVQSQRFELKPEYPGGIQEFYKYISKHFKVPKVDGDMSVRIDVSFVVEKDGTLSTFKIVTDPGYGMGDEALRVIKLCRKKWKPGIIDGEVVRAQYNMPITINIKGP